MTKVDAELKDKGVRISTVFLFNRGSVNSMSVSPYITLEKIDKTKRGKVPTTMIPTFCPFCGVSYKADDPAEPAPATA